LGILASLLLWLGKDLPQYHSFVNTLLKMSMDFAGTPETMDAHKS
jgi:hypothetical protein